MQNAVSKFSLSEPEQLVISSQGIYFRTTNTHYKWQSISKIKQYFTVWNWIDIQSNIEIYFNDGDAFRVSEFRVSSKIYDSIYSGIDEYIPSFNRQQAESLAMREFIKKRKYLRFLGLLTNLYWGGKPTVFTA